MDIPVNMLKNILYNKRLVLTGNETDCEILYQYLWSERQDVKNILDEIRSAGDKWHSVNTNEIENDDIVLSVRQADNFIFHNRTNYKKVRDTADMLRKKGIIDFSM